MTTTFLTARVGRRAAVASILLAAASAASAHTGHGTHSFFEGLAHPLGADHLLAMVAVGLWSVVALPTRRAWLGPATFMTALVLSAALGASGVTVPGLESAIAASVAVMGLLLVLATRQLPAALGLGVIAIAASLHGLAHGAEAPASGGFASYAIGFLLSTAALHAAGVLAGLAARRGLAQQPLSRALNAAGWFFGGAGAYLLTQL